MENKIIYYEDELNDEFSEAQITPRRIDEKYKYFHKNPFWNFCSFVMQNFVSMPIKLGSMKIKFRLKYVGKEKFKQCKKTGYFIYANHTQPFEDTFIPSVANYPKRNYLIVHPANVSMKGMQTLVELLGAIPIPDTKDAMKNFLDFINYRISKKSSITIYPEAHIWPYYTKIRPFKSVSFKYPVKLNVPVFCITNTYQKRGKNKVKITSYVDGPFYKDDTLNPREAQEKLRNTVYEQMVERSKNSNYEVIKYIKK